MIKPKFKIMSEDLGYGRFAFGCNIAYEKFYHMKSELYLNIYIGNRLISIGRFYIPKGEQAED